MAPQREVEVLHDRLLAWFDADPALSPRDVMVMVPDMATFAPHIQAVFGRFAAGQARHIPYSVADTTPRQSPLVQALEQLLSLPASRVSLADWLGLFEVAAVRQRFGVSEADVAQLHDWLAVAGVRWGLDASHRMAWGVPAGVTGPGPEHLGFWPAAPAAGLCRGCGCALGRHPAAGSPERARRRRDQRPAGMGRGGRSNPAGTVWQQDTRRNGVDLCSALSRAFLPPRMTLTSGSSSAAWPRWTCGCRLAKRPGLRPRCRWMWCASIGCRRLKKASLQQRFFGGGVQFGTLMPMRSIPVQGDLSAGHERRRLPAAKGRPRL